MIPISTIVPMAMTMPASVMILASTPNSFMLRKAISTASGNVTATTRLARTCSRNSTTTTIVIRISCPNASIRVSTVSSINSVRS